MWQPLRWPEKYYHNYWSPLVHVARPRSTQQNSSIYLPVAQFIILLLPARQLGVCRAKQVLFTAASGHACDPSVRAKIDKLVSEIVVTRQEYAMWTLEVSRPWWHLTLTFDLELLFSILIRQLLCWVRIYPCGFSRTQRTPRQLKLMAISLQRGPVDPKFQVEGVGPHQPFFSSKN